MSERGDGRTDCERLTRVSLRLASLLKEIRKLGLESSISRLRGEGKGTLLKTNPQARSYLFPSAATAANRDKGAFINDFHIVVYYMPHAHVFLLVR